MREEKFGLRLKWLGCACFEMDFGGLTVVNDPWITDNPATELTWEAVERCDYITVTHAHYDHITDIPALVKKFDPRLMCGENTALPLMRYADMVPMRVLPMYPDQELDLEAVKVRALYGRHVIQPGTVSQRDEQWRTNPRTAADPLMQELGRWGDFEYRNYLYTLPTGIKVLLWGNTVDLPEQRAILRAVRPDIAIVQGTRKNIPADLARLCKCMGARVVIPHHLDFPRDNSAWWEELSAQLRLQAPDIRCIRPTYGQWLEL